MSSVPETPRRARLVGLSLLAGMLAAGLLAGVALDRAFAHRAPGSGRDACEGRRTHMFERLDLTSAQRERVDAILERRRGSMEAIWRETGPRMRALVDSTEAEIRQVLRPEQRERFDQLKEERRAHSFGKKFLLAPPEGRKGSHR